MNDDLADKLSLIEDMILEGRRSMERFGWCYLMWGVLYLAAFTWSSLSPSNRTLPWAILMPAGGLASAGGAIYIGRRAVKTTLVGRALSAIWWGFGFTCIALTLCANGGQLHGLAIPAIFFLLLGLANFASGRILRVPLQVAVAALWWVAAALMLLLPTARAIWVFPPVALLCLVGFGAYMMVKERASA